MIFPNGFPLTIVTSRADVHDSKGAIGLVIDVVCKYRAISELEVDDNYCGSYNSVPSRIRHGHIHFQ